MLFYLIFAESTTSDVELVTMWSVIYLLVTIPLTIYGMISIRIKHQISLPAKDISKYVVIAIISSGFTFVLMEDQVVYTESVYDFVPQLIPLFLLNIILYFGICYFIDPSVKKLFHSIINEFRK